MRAPKRREMRQDLRLHGEKHIVMRTELRRRSGPRPTAPRVHRPFDREALVCSAASVEPRASSDTGQSGAIEGIGEPRADGARPHDGYR